MNAPYPWLEPAWQRVQNALASDRLAHAYLLGGREGLGKLELARRLIRMMLCERRTADARACATCRSCMLYQAGNHPDFRLVQPEDDHKSILIEQVRDLIEFYALKAHYHGRKIALVHPAENMNRAAANALLKLLEEPPAGAVLILVAHRAGLLPGTIVSRCQRIDVRLPDWSERSAWLERETERDPDLPAARELVLRGAPLALVDQLRSGRPALLNDIVTDLGAVRSGELDCISAARRYAEVEAARFIDALEALVQALVVLGAGQAPRHLKLPPREQRALQEIANELNSKRLFFYLDRVGEARQLVQRSSGVRGSEIVENLWFDWARATRAESKL